MPSSCRPQVPDKSTAFDAQVHRYLRAFQKALRHRPTNLQRDLMANAAVTQARFDQAARNPNIGAQDLAHLERIARKAAAAMLASFPTRPRNEGQPRRLASYLARVTAP